MSQSAGIISGRQIFRILVVFGWLWLFTVPAFAEPLHLLSWNVRNYLSQNQVIEGRWRPDYPKPEAEKAALREVLLSERADVVFFQEMGAEPYLRELQRDLRTMGLDYPYRAMGRGVDTVRHLAVLSRIPLSEVNLHAVADEVLPPIRRGLMEVVIEYDGEVVRVFNVHLKSRWTVDRADPLAQQQRGAEMERLVDIVSERRKPGDTLLILGDFNEPEDFPARLFLLDRLSALQRLPQQDSAGADWTFYWEREDRREAIDAIYYWPPDQDEMEVSAVRIVDGPEVMQASDHRPLGISLGGER